MPGSGRAFGLTDLSMDLVVRIIELSRPSEPVDGYAMDYKWRRYSRFHQLNLVCKSFRAAFSDHPELCSFLWLAKQQPLSEIFTSLLCWFKRHNNCVRYMRANGQEQSVLYAVTGFMKSPSFHLLTIRLDDIQQPMLALLQPFTALTHCDLASAHGSFIQLEPILSLRSLTLRSANFTHLNVMSQLTKLVLDHANVFTYLPCSFVTAVEEIHLRRSFCQLCHPQGLSACQQLRVLQCRDSRITSQVTEDDHLDAAIQFAETEFWPVGLTPLTSLTELHLSTTGDNVEDVTEVCLLPNLRCLCLECMCDIPEQLTSLCRLTSLVLLSYDAPSVGVDQAGCMEIICSSWNLMHALEHLTIGYGRFEVSDLMGLLELASLQFVNFPRFVPTSSFSCKSFGQFMHSLGRLRPDVRVSYSLDFYGERFSWKFE